MSFSPNLGRWIQEDPIRFDAGDPNLYRANENSPVSNLDPSGLETTSFVIANKLGEGQIWSVGMELKWHEDRKALGGIKIDHWKSTGVLSGATKADLIGKLNFTPLRIGATATYKSNSIYFFYLSEVSSIDPKKTWRPDGKIKVGRKISACGYHEVEAKYMLWTNEKKSFTFVATAVADKKVTDIAFAKETTLVGTGVIRLRIGKPPGMGVHIFPEATLGGNTTAPDNGNWVSVLTPIRVEKARDFPIPFAEDVKTRTD